MEFDFSGWATKAGLKCSDGLTIMKDAVNQNGYTEVNVLKHSLTDDSGNEIEYGISNIDYLFLDARNMTNQPTDKQESQINEIQEEGDAENGI